MEASEISSESARPFVSVVIPAYNEEQRLPDTLEQVLTYLEHQGYPFEVIVVDDGSRDRTLEVANACCSRHENVCIIENDHRGKGYTVRTGVLASRGHIVLFSDADLSTPIQDLGLLLPWFDRGYDIVIGSREGQGAQRIHEPLYRHLMGRVFNFVVQTLTVRGIQDTQCGFKAFRGEVARDVFGQMRLYGKDSQTVSGAMVTAFDVEVLFIGTKLGYRIKEVPVHWHYSKETKVNPLRDSWRNLRDVLAVRWNDARGLYGRRNGLEK